MPLYWQCTLGSRTSERLLFVQGFRAGLFAYAARREYARASGAEILF